MFLEKNPTIEEFDKIINLPKDKKSPGLDGLPIEFYRFFWSDIRHVYFEMIQEVWENEIMPISTRTAVISTMYKDESRKCLVNYRPLSLTNCDHKILTFLFAQRLNTVLNNIISNDQVSYIKGRYIGTSIRNLIDLYEHCENFKLPGALICADFEKAL